MPLLSTSCAPHRCVPTAIDGMRLPHAAGEDRYLYPAVEPLLKAHGMATVTMRMDHRAIEGYVRSIEEAAARLRSAGNTERAAAARALARLVWQLQALFDVHLQKEEQIYMPLLGRYVAEAEQQHILQQMHEGPARSASPNGEATLDVRTMAPARRHAVIFATYEALGAGRAFVLVNHG